ncbi:MAG: DNA-binding protein [Roseiarcus sp.]|jgi:predicted DNA-binding transcriptional regulator AlpA
MTERYSLSIREFGAMTGFGRTAIYAALKDQRLFAKKLGKRTVILKEEAERFLKGLPDYDCRADKV